MNELNVQTSSSSSCCPGHEQNQPSIRMNNGNGSGNGYGNGNSSSCLRTIVDGSSGLNSIIYTSTVETNMSACQAGTCQKDGTCCFTCPSDNLSGTCESPPSSSSNSSVSSLTSLSSPGSPANVPAINYLGHHSISCGGPGLGNFVSSPYVTAQAIPH